MELTISAQVTHNHAYRKCTPPLKKIHGDALMSKCMHRRQMLKTTAAVGTGFWIGMGMGIGTGSSGRGRAEDSPNEKLNVVCIGIGGRG